MTDSVFLYWDVADAKIKSFGSTNRGKATIVKIELEVTDGYALGRILRELQDAQRRRPPPPPPPKPKPAADQPTVLRLASPRRRLPAPPLLLPAPRKHI